MSKVQLHSCVSLIDAKEFPAKLESTNTRNNNTEAKTNNLGDVATADSDFPENELLLR